MKHKKVIGISILAVLILAAGIILIALRGSRQQMQGVVSEPDDPVTGTPAATQAPAETLKTLTQRPKEDSLFTPEEALILLANTYFQGDRTGLAYDGSDKITGYYRISKSSQGSSAGEQWDVDPFTGNVYQFGKKVSNVLLRQDPTDEAQTFEALYSGKMNGTQAIEIQLQMNDRFVKGGYRLDDEQEWTEFSGVYEDNAFYLAHDLKKHVECTYVAEDILEGFLEDGGQIYPFYAVKEGNTIQAPDSSDVRLAAWEGKWYGAGSPVDANSVVTITPIFNNLIWFEITAKLEDNWSGFFSFAIVQDNIAELIVGKDYFRFYMGENGNLILDSSNYTYHCDDGAKFDAEYVRAPLENPQTGTVEAVPDDKNTVIPDVYLEKLAANGYDPERDGEIAYFSRQDMDLDGYDEVIVAAGSIDGTPAFHPISKLYIFREMGEQTVQLGDDLALQGYGIYGIRLIRFNGMPKQYLYLELSNGAGLSGFSVLDVTGDEPSSFCYSASPTGSGNDYLVDSDQDGQYEGYQQNCWSYDTLYFSIIRTYTLADGQFVLAAEKVEIPGYPDNVQDTLLQYLSLKALGTKLSTEVTDRLSEIFPNDAQSGFSFSSDGWYEALFNTIMGFSEKYILFDFTENTETADVILSIEGDTEQGNRYRFEMVKKDGRWTIVSISNP